MTTSLKSFDDKIDALKLKKKELENKQAQHLFSYVSKELGPSSSPQLAAIILKEAWEQATQNQKETWIKSAETFQFTKPRKSRKNRKTARETSAKNNDSRV